MSTCLDPSFRLGCGPDAIIATLRAERKRIRHRESARRWARRNKQWLDLDRRANLAYYASYYRYWRDRKKRQTQ